MKIEKSKNFVSFSWFWLSKLEQYNLDWLLDEFHNQDYRIIHFGMGGFFRTYIVMEKK